MARRKQTKVEALVTRLYGQHCRGQIGVMDIGKVFDAGTKAALRCAADAAASGTVPFDVATCEDVIASAMAARFAELRCDGEAR